MSERGQITIDHGVRKELGVQPGMLAYQRVGEGYVEVVFLPAPHRRSQFGVFHEFGRRGQVMTADQLEEAVMEAVTAEQAHPDRAGG